MSGPCRNTDILVANSRTFSRTAILSALFGLICLVVAMGGAAMEPIC
jgi:hypothetical protein